MARRAAAALSALPVLGAASAAWLAAGLATVLVLSGCAARQPAGAQRSAAAALPAQPTPASLRAVHPALPASAVDQPAPGKVAVWLTSGDQSRLLQRQPDIALGLLPAALMPWAPGLASAAAPPTAPSVVSVERGARRQRMAGFGAAISAASAWLLMEQLDAGQRQALLAELFGPPPGIALSVARLPLGANEFALSQYSYDDLPPGQSDAALAQFSIEPDRAYLLPLLTQVLSYNASLELIASPASAPGWMKTSASLLQGTLKPEAYASYARYLKRYVDVYLEEGIPIHALTVASQPSAPPADAPGMRLDDAARAQLIGQHLGPLLADEGPLILDWDGNRDTAQAPLAVLGDQAAGQYVAGVAWHCYAGEVGAQAAVAAAYPGKDSYLTECSGGAWAPGWSDNLTHFARTLVQGAARGGARGIMLGNLALDPHGGPRIGGCSGCRGVVTVGEGGALTRNPEYYALAHASRFARSGAWRVATSGALDGIDSAAFDNPDGTLALIAVNSAAAPRTFAVHAGAHTFTATLPAASVATYVWRP